jgi:hypothetical protein
MKPTMRAMHEIGAARGGVHPSVAVAAQLAADLELVVGSTEPWRAGVALESLRGALLELLVEAGPRRARRIFGLLVTLDELETRLASGHVACLRGMERQCHMLGLV